MLATVHFFGCPTLTDILLYPKCSCLTKFSHLSCNYTVSHSFLKKEHQISSGTASNSCLRYLNGPFLCLEEEYLYWYSVISIIPYGLIIKETTINSFCAK